VHISVILETVGAWLHYFSHSELLGIAVLAAFLAAIIYREVTENRRNAHDIFIPRRVIITGRDLAARRMPSTLR
jgi:hypothetical protein